MDIKYSNLNKSFNSVSGAPGFNLSIGEISFEIGKITYIMGHNGSGKSVLLKLLAGQYRPNKGHVKAIHKRNKWFADKHHCSIVRQNSNESLSLELTVKENIIIRQHNLSPLEKIFPLRKLNERVDFVLNDYSELDRKKDQIVSNLSGGQKQTLAFVGATISHSPQLLLDEFLSATDQSTKNNLLQYSAKFALDTPASVVVVSHDINLALSNADRIIVLKEGALIADLLAGSSSWENSYIEKLLE
ncbi:energy-coupling factor ABC transporter ATP-binding protein [bacterium]|nr:energy-coupling factor ABC transporter ATP-binding protein [bacterium]